MKKKHVVMLIVVSVVLTFIGAFLKIMHIKFFQTFMLMGLLLLITSVILLFLIRKSES
jgi:hypothetical protein